MPHPKQESTESKPVTALEDVSQFAVSATTSPGVQTGTDSQKEGSPEVGSCSNDADAHDVASSMMRPEERTQLTEQLISDHHASVYRYALWLTGCSNAAEDVTQEVFLRAFRAVQNLREQAAAKGWLMTITRNEFARWCTKSKKHTVQEWQETEGGTTEPFWESTETNDWIHRGLAELNNDYRVVVLMYYFEQLSYAEIASALDIPIGTVMSRLSRAKNQLKKALDEVG